MRDEFFKKLTPEEEVPFREWARTNWEPGVNVDPCWHPVVRDEIAKMQRPTMAEFLPGIEDTLNFLKEEVQQKEYGKAGCSRIEVGGKAYTTTYMYDDVGVLTLKVLEVGNEV